MNKIATDPVPDPDNSSPLGQSSFNGLRGQLVPLPRNMLTSETSIKQLIESIEQGSFSLEEKIRFLEQNNLLPFVAGAPLSGEMPLLIDIDDDLQQITYYHITENIPDVDLNGDIDKVLATVSPVLLATIPDPNLIFSYRKLHEHAPVETGENAVQLFSYGKRITRYMGVSVTWDQGVDKRVWTTNIDTVHFLKNIRTAGVFSDPGLESLLEIGIGGGGITKTLCMRAPSVKNMYATDISASALLCARRNIDPVLKPDQTLTCYLGKGIKEIEVSVDALFVNPPYVPAEEPFTEADPYRGTGLIREIIATGANFLNKAKPSAAVYMQLSSLADKDFDSYLQQFGGWKVETVGDPLFVPLKILKISENQKWLDFLVREHGLVDSSDLLRETGFQYWHTIRTLKLTPLADSK